MTTEPSSSSVDLDYLRKTVEMVGYLQGTHCEQLISEVERLRADLEHTRQIVGAPWLIALVQAFSPKEIPLDVDETGGYEESTTRWGPNPIYEAIPARIREIAKTRLDAADVKT